MPFKKNRNIFLEAYKMLIQNYRSFHWIHKEQADDIKKIIQNVNWKETLNPEQCKQVICNVNVFHTQKKIT